MSESFAELFEESLQNVAMTPGTLVMGEVVDIDSDWVTVNAGLKSEAVIPRSQFINDANELEIAVGDTVKVALEAVEDGFGETRLSREKAKRAEAWEVLQTKFEAEETVKGYISGKVKGGFTVSINNIQGFLPGSLVDVRPIRDVDHLEGKELEFKLIKLDPKRNNIVVSRRGFCRKLTALSVKSCWLPWKKVRSLKVSSRTSPTTVHSSIWVVLTACCTSPTWLGSVSPTRAKC